MPSAKVSTATKANPGFLRSERTANFRSCIVVSAPNLCTYDAWKTDALVATRGMKFGELGDNRQPTTEGEWRAAARRGGTDCHIVDAAGASRHKLILDCFLIAIAGADECRNVGFSFVTPSGNNKSVRRRKLMHFALLIYESPEAFASRKSEASNAYIGAWRAYHKA